MRSFGRYILCGWIGLLSVASGALGQTGLDPTAPDTLAQAPFDVLFGEAHLDALFKGGLEGYEEDAVRLYRGLLGSLDGPLAPQEQQILNQHVAQLALILPEDVRQRVMDGDLDASPESWTFKERAGQALVSWWQSQDPLPATRNNERMEEHLTRVAYAEQHYSREERTTGLDDRGEIYVRYGAPSKITVVTFDDAEMTNLVYQPGVVVNLTDFPDNEFWSYGHIDRAAYFLFVKNVRHYEVAESNELVPPALRSGFSNSPRGIQKVYMTLAVLRNIYRQLAPAHPDFMMRYADVVDYSRGLEDGSLGSQAQLPYVFAESFLIKSRTEDDQATARRETLVARQETEVFRDTETLPVGIRTVRFLAEDGTTRTEIYWSPEPGGLSPSKNQQEALEEEGYSRFNQYLVKMTVVQKAERYDDRVVNVKHYFLTDLLSEDEAAIPVQTMVVEGDTGRYHLAMQWDQHLTDEVPRRDEEITLGPHMKVATYQADSLTALVAEAGVLEMSDLRLEFVPKQAEEAGSFETMPYPFTTTSPDVALGLYFEAYHLSFGEDDRTHYEVEYGIERAGDGGGLLRFLGRRPDERTTVRTPYVGTSRTARENILLDLSEWEGDGDLRITVRITDQTTGQQVERSLQFTMRS
ncbi:MAG: GWxTD domain-containing protein [Rhodothermales bacterium]